MHVAVPRDAWLIIFVVIVTLTGASTPGRARAQQPASFVVIGCLEQSQGAFVIKDFRNGTAYRLVASVETLDWHVGHQLEVHGTLEPGSSDNGATLKVDKVIYISTRCAPPAR